MLETFVFSMAERVGFEPTEPLTAHTISSRIPHKTLLSLIVLQRSKNKACVASYSYKVLYLNI